jgi:peptidoglycan hydrolase-like protein with peptidoglycan-binding domain/TPR repeat protein
VSCVVVKVRLRHIHAYVGAPLVAAPLLALVLSGLSAAPAAAATQPPATAPTGALSAMIARGDVLTPGTGYGSGYGPSGSQAVRSVQMLLARAGYPAGPIDGRYGPRTTDAVMRYQAGAGLAADGIVGPQTAEALRSPASALQLGAGYPTGSPLVRDLQRRLSRAGHSPGPIDGLYGPLTKAAVMGYQADHGLPVDGTAGVQTLADLRLHFGAPRNRGSQPRAGAPKTPAPTRIAAPRKPRTAGRPAGPTTGSHHPGALSPLWFVPLGLVVAAIALGGAWLVWERRRRSPLAQPLGERETTERAPDAIAAGSRHETADDSRGAADEEGSPESELPARVPVGAPQSDAAAPESDAAAPGSDSAAPESDSAASLDAQLEGDITAAFNRGVLLEHRHDLAGAEEAYRRAAWRGHAAATSNLGVILEKKGDVARAEAAYRRADERGDANGAFNLGVLLESRGDIAGAGAAYQRAAGRGHAAATSNLGVMLEEHGYLAGAEAAYRRADEAGDANGAFNLGVLLESRGDLSEAEQAYRRAEESGDATLANLAHSARLDLARSAVGV